MTLPAVPSMFVRLFPIAAFAIVVHPAAANALPERLELECTLIRNGHDISAVARGL